MGMIDQNGIYQYDETDNETTFSDLLNLGMSSVSEVLDDTGWTPISTPAGWSSTRDIAVRRIGGRVYWRGRVAPTTALGGTQPLLPPGTVPAWARAQSIFDSMRTCPSNHSSTTAEAAFKNAAVGTDGSLTVWCGQPNTDPINLAGLSGYDVD